MVDRRSTVVALCVLFLLFRSSFEQLVAPERPSRVEWLALLQLRSSLGLRSKEWPLKSNPCLSWAGVQCRNGSIVEINISGFRRTRVGSENPQFAVDSLADFTLLESFNASNFELPGPIPDWFGQRLTALQLLDLRSCSIFGSIPYSIGNMTRLTVLYLSGNSLTGIIPSTLGQLVHLSVLDLSQNSLTGSIPSSFGSLENLTLLDMSFNFLAETIPPAIGNLSKLQSLNLSSNSLSSSIPAQLGNLSSLVDLDLSFNSLSGSILPDFRGLRNLQRMVIGNNLLSGSLPGNLFSPLSQLQLIVMNHNHFTGNLPDTLWSMPRLLLLDASGNNFTGTLPNLSSNPNITTAPVFNLSDNLFYGGLTTIIGRLGFIDLSGNYFQGKVLDYATRNESLTENCLQNVSNQRNLAECSSFYADRSLTFDNFGLPQAQGPLPPKSGKKKRKTILILAGVLGGIGFIAFLVIVIVLILRCPRQRIVMNQRGTSVGPTIPTGGPPPPPGPALNFTILGEVFTYQQILQATSEFSDSNLIKQGHSGDLFRAVLEGGVPIVIKRINLGSVKKESYMLELDIFSKVSHPRLVPLLGRCLENENEKFLIYKYMPNGDLSSSLFKKTNLVDDSIQSLDWITRLKIAIGAAEGLSYLHHECNPPLVHRDVQASSILLDDKFEVRLGSLSEVCTQEGDVHQSRITRLLRFPQSSEQGASGTPTSTCAYDVYCFGKVLLELVTGKLGISASSDSTLKDMLEQTLPYVSIYDKELVTNIVDPTLIIDEDLLEEVWAMAVVARSCLNPKPSRRPLMKYILKALENPLKVVRDENISSSTNSARLRTTSSRGSWNATAVFGSWRHSSSDMAVGPTNGGGGSFKQIGTTGSQGSRVNGGVVDHSSSNRRQSNEIFPEPLDMEDGDRERRG